MFTERKTSETLWETRIAGLRETRRGAILPPPLFPASKKEQSCSPSLLHIFGCWLLPQTRGHAVFWVAASTPRPLSSKKRTQGKFGLSLAKRRVLTASPYQDSSPARAQGYTGAPCFPSAPPEDTPDPVRSPGSLFQRCCNTSSMEVPQAWQGP